MRAVGRVPRVTGQTGKGTLEGHASGREGREVPATDPIEDLTETWPATPLHGARLVTAQLVQAHVATAPADRGNDNALGPCDARIGRS